MSKGLAMCGPSMVNNPINNLTCNQHGLATNGSASATINNLIRFRFNKSSHFFKSDLYSHYGCVNALEFSKNGKLMISGGDDKRVLLWNTEQALYGVGKPSVMKSQHSTNIFSLEFDSGNNRILSGGNDDQIIVHDALTGECIKVFFIGDAVYCLSMHPTSDFVFTSATDGGRIYHFDLRQSYNPDSLPTLIHKRSAFHAVMHNPLVPNLIVTANSKSGVELYDIRFPKRSVITYNGGLVPSTSSMSVCFNSRGTQIIALRRRLPVILYNLSSPYPLAEFDHKFYYNSCTMKSCCFAGPSDEYVLSGSDDFQLYMWKIPDEIMQDDMNATEYRYVDKTHMILHGHRSIVNHVRYNPSNAIIASSGVEKKIKIWSPFNLKEIAKEKKSDHSYTLPNPRKIYTHEEYVRLVLEGGPFSPHDYSHESTQEDPRMLAFFDTLIQRDVGGITSGSDEDIEEFDTGIFADTPSPCEDSDDESELTGNRSGENEAGYLKSLEVQSEEYIQAFCKRMEISLKAKAKPTHMARRSSGPLPRRRAQRNTSRNMYDGDNEAEELEDMRTILKKIREKKKEQLRKLAGSASRSIRNRLKRYRTRDENESSSTGIELSRFKKRLETVMSSFQELSDRPRKYDLLRRGLRHRLRKFTYHRHIINPATSSDSDDSEYQVEENATESESSITTNDQPSVQIIDDDDDDDDEDEEEDEEEDVEDEENDEEEDNGSNENKIDNEDGDGNDGDDDEESEEELDNEAAIETEEEVEEEEEEGDNITRNVYMDSGTHEIGSPTRRKKCKKVFENSRFTVEISDDESEEEIIGKKPLITTTPHPVSVTSNSRSGQEKSETSSRISFSLENESDNDLSMDFEKRFSVRRSPNPENLASDYQSGPECASKREGCSMLLSLSAKTHRCLNAQDASQNSSLQSTSYDVNHAHPSHSSSTCLNVTFKSVNHDSSNHKSFRKRQIMHESELCKDKKKKP